MARTDVHHYTWHAYWERRSKLLVVKVTWTMCTTVHFTWATETGGGGGGLHVPGALPFKSAPAAIYSVKLNIISQNTDPYGRP